MNTNEKLRFKLYLKEKIKVFIYLDGMTSEDYQNRMRRAMLWHDPQNWKQKDWKETSRSIKDRENFEYLFNEARDREGMGPTRFYFYFKDVDCTDWVKVAWEFKNCPNYEKYLEVWEKHAPIDIKHELFFLGSLTKMTVKGMKHEQNEIKRLGLTPASGTDDYFRGIDAWTPNGEPVQIKSPATQKGII